MPEGHQRGVERPQDSLNDEQMVTLPARFSDALKKEVQRYVSIEILSDKSAQDLFSLRSHFVDEALANEFLQNINTNFLPYLETSKKRGIDIDVCIQTLLRLSEGIPSKHLMPFWCNIGLPLIGVFGKEPGEYEDAVKTVLKIPLEKFSEWSREENFGDQPGKGFKPLLDAMPLGDGSLSILKYISLILSEMSNASQRAFREYNGPRLLQSLENITEDKRVEVWRQILDADAKLTEDKVLRRWAFVRLHAYKVINEFAIDEKKGAASLLRIERDLTGIKAFKHQLQGEPLLIKGIERLTFRVLQRFQRELENAGGNIDVIVHPHASGRWINKKTNTFDPGFAGSTGRTPEDYYQYCENLDALLKGNTSDLRPKIILCDHRYMDETAAWVKRISPMSTVWLIPTAPSDSDNRATPLVDVMRTIATKAQDALFGGHDPYSIRKKSSWELCNELLSELKVMHIRISGEYALARYGDMGISVDSSGNLNLLDGCVEGARRELIKSATIDTANDACFPDSQQFTTSQGRKVFEGRDYVGGLPNHMQEAVASLCQDSKFAVFALQEVYAHNSKGFIPNAHVEQMEDALRELSKTASMQVATIASKILIVSRKDHDVSGRINNINSALHFLSSIAQTTNKFGIDAVTQNAFDACHDLAEMISILKTAAARSEKIQRKFPDLYESIPSIVSRIISPVSTNETSFDKECLLIDAGSRIAEEHGKSSLSNKRLQVTVSFLNYVEELRELAKLGYLTGKVFYPEAGPDLLPILALAEERAESNEKAKIKTRKRPNKNQMIWLSAGDFELAHGSVLLKKLSILATDPFGRHAISFNSTRNLEALLAVGKTGEKESHIETRLKHLSDYPEYWKHIVKALQTERITILPGHSSDPTPAVEYMSGTGVDCLVLKGLEPWAYSKTKRGAVSDKQRGLFEQSLKNLVALAKPGTYILVSAADPTAAEYFSNNLGYIEIKKSARIQSIQGDYPVSDQSLRFAPSADALVIGGVEVSAPLKDVPYLDLIPRGDFRIFQVKPKPPREIPLAEHAHDMVIAQRGSRSYQQSMMQELQKVELMFLGSQRGMSFFVIEEQQKTILMHKMLLDKDGKNVSLQPSQSFQDMTEEQKKEAIARGIDRHPTLWQRYRNLIKMQKDLPSLYASFQDERMQLEHLIAIQTFIEERYYSGNAFPESRNPLDIEALAADYDPEAITRSDEEKLFDLNLGEQNDRESLRARLERGIIDSPLPSSWGNRQSGFYKRSGD